MHSRINLSQEVHQQWNKHEHADKFVSSKKELDEPTIMVSNVNLNHSNCARSTDEIHCDVELNHVSPFNLNKQTNF